MASSDIWVRCLLRALAATELITVAVDCTTIGYSASQSCHEKLWKGCLTSGMYDAATLQAEVQV